MSRGATNLSKQAMRLRLDDPKSHREALGQLRRYQNFEMPGFENVTIIEGALTGLSEPESRALSERRRLEKSRQEQADAKEHAKRLEEDWQLGGVNRREAVRRARKPCRETAGNIDLVKALAGCVDAWMRGDPVEARMRNFLVGFAR